MHEKLKTASYSEQIQILTLVPGKWSQMYYWVYFNVFEYLWNSYKIKKVGKILAKPASKITKNNTTETLRLVTNVYEDEHFSRSVSKQVHKENTQIKILGSQSSVSWDWNGVFWLAQKWPALFAFVALIKMLCC